MDELIARYCHRLLFKYFIRIMYKSPNVPEIRVNINMKGVIEYKLNIPGCKAMREQALYVPCHSL